MIATRTSRLIVVLNSDDTYPETTASMTPRARPPATEP
jgi:hypothetical protein